MKQKEKKQEAGKKAETRSEARTEARKRKSVYSIGKRKRAVAWASLKPGKGVVMFNSKPLESIENETTRLLLKEPLLLTGEAWKNLNISVKTKGGGILGQAQAARQAVARGLADLLGSGIKKVFLEYDRNLLVYDSRRTEPHKPPRSSQGPRRYKQRSKR